MSREITMKLNQILYQRSKDWYENRPKTGILKLLERDKPGKEEELQGKQKLQIPMDSSMMRHGINYPASLMKFYLLPRKP